MTLSPMLGLAAKWRGRRVGLYGGSFNPAHGGHWHVALAALRTLPIDAVWFLVSPGNPQKANSDMAPLADRLAGVNALIGSHPKLFATDIEAQINTRYSADTLDKLRTLMPATRFLWIMGADNLATFHTWYRWQDIAHTMPIAVFDRPGYGERGLRSVFASRFAQHRTEAKNIFKSKAGGAWTFVTIPRHPASASDIRAQMRAVKGPDGAKQ